MKVLMTADTIGGVWRYALELARGLQCDNVEVILATMGRLPSAGQVREAARCGNVTLCSSQYALEWMNDAWMDVDRASFWLLELEGRYQPDVIHLNGYSHAALRWRAPKLVVCHSCVLSWWLAVKRCRAPVCDWGDYGARVQRGLQAADWVIAPSVAMMSSIRELYGELPCPTAVIANAVDPSEFWPAGKEAYICSAGRLWDAGKNIRTLMEAGEDLAWPVYVAGELAEAHRSDSAFGSNVIALGQLSGPRVAALMRTAAIYCLPAHYEPFGLSVLEAAHAQCALVLGDIPSLRENWEGAALFVTPDDVNELSAVLDELIGNPALLNEYARRAHARAQQFQPRQFAESYLNIYRQIASSHANAATAAWGNPRCA